MNELGPSEFEKEEKEPTITDLVEACRKRLTEEQIEELSQLKFDEALGLAFTYLIEAGEEDPEQYLKEKGILE